MIKIINNFLDKEYFKKIEDLFFNNVFFPWFPNTILSNSKHKQFVHIFYRNYASNSNYNELLKPFYLQLKIKALIKVKANYLWKTEKIVEHGFHTDTAQHIGEESKPNWKTAIFYVNTNNGYTKFETKKKILSKANRLVIFPAYVKHTGTTCTDKDERIVLNLNYYD